MKIGDLVYRRPGDPPLDEVIEMLRRKRSVAENQASTEDHVGYEDEL